MLRTSCSLLIHIVCVFGPPISMPYTRLTEVTESNRCCKTSADPVSKAISSVNQRLLNKLPPTSTPTPIVLYSASDMMFSIYILKRSGDRMHPCLDPIVVLNHSPLWPLHLTVLTALL